MMTLEQAIAVLRDYLAADGQNDDENDELRNAA